MQYFNIAKKKRARKVRKVRSKKARRYSAS